jgi:hypothetical protein
VDVGLAEAGLREPAGERRDDVGVAGSARRGVVAAQADVLAEQHPVEEAVFGQAPQPLEAPLGVPLVQALHGVELHPRPAPGDRQVVVVVRHHVAVPHHHAGRVDALLGKQVELGVADRPAGGVGGDGQARTPVGAGRGPERPLLLGGDHAVAADLADDAGPDPLDALLDVAQDEVRHRVGRQLVELGREVRAAVEARPSDDVQAGRLRHRPQRHRVAVQATGRDVDQRAAPRVGVPHQLGLREGWIIEQAVAAVLTREVDEDVLVRQGHAQLVGGHRPGHGHHGRAHTGILLQQSARGEPARGTCPDVRRGRAGRDPLPARRQ